MSNLPDDNSDEIRPLQEEDRAEGLSLHDDQSGSEPPVIRRAFPSRTFLWIFAVFAIIVSAVLILTGSVECYLGPMDVCAAPQPYNKDVIVKANHPEKRLQVGLDASPAIAVEDAGGVFSYANGTRAPALEIVKDYGYDWIRLRVMVAPDGKYGLFQDLDYTIRMA